MFLQNWAGLSVFTLESADIYPPNKITTQSGQILHTWQPFPPQSLEQHWPSRCGFRKAGEQSSGNLPSTGRGWGNVEGGRGKRCAFLKTMLDMIPQLFSSPQSFIHSQQIMKTTVTKELIQETKNYN